MPNEKSFWSRPVVLFEGFEDNEPDVPAFDDEDLVSLLTNHADPACSLETCQGRNCAAKKAALCWSPASYREGSTRGNADVTAINYAVFDLDHVPAGSLATLEADIAEYEHVVYSTHSHTPTDECYRLVFPLTRPVKPGEWEKVYDALVDALDLPAVDRRADLARLYACPTARAGVTPFAAHRRGVALDVDEALEVALGPRAAVPTPPPSDAPVEPVSLAELRRRLSDARRSKARGSDREKAQADVLGRVLDGRALADSGERDDTVLRACGLLAFWSPPDTPWSAALEILRPSLSAMDCEPEGLDSWIEVAREKYARASRNRAVQDGAAASARERTLAALKSVADRASRSLREVADELDARGAEDGDGSDWTDLLIEVGKNGPKVCEHNAQVLLACAPDLRGTIAWDSLGKRVVIRGGPLAGASPNFIGGAAAAHLQKTYSFFGNETLVGRTLSRLAFENPVEPIAEYIGELAWDGVARIDSFLEDYFGVEVGDDVDLTRYVRSVSRKWLISLVARGLRPGCKVDAVLILEGAQGVGKSSGLRALVGSDWFLDTALDVGSKDAMQAISSAWLVELGELASLTRAEQPRIRQFITSQVDKFRPPYGHVTEEVPRRCVLAGTTNPEGSGYLTDRTGNRRYWVVTATRVDVPGIERVRDQVFAEAAEAFRAGDKWWFPEEDAALAAAQVEARAVESTYEEAIERWWYGEPPLRRPEYLMLSDVADLCLKMTVDRVDHRARVEIGIALARLGFKRRGKTRYYEPTREMIVAPQRVTLAAARSTRLLSSLPGGKK